MQHPNHHTFSILALILAPLATHALPLPSFGVPLTRPPPFFPTTQNHPRSPSSQGPAKRTVLSGHGILLLPATAQVQLPTDPADEDVPEVAQISVNGKTYQVVGGIDATIDGIPLSEYSSGKTQGLGDPEPEKQQGVVVGAEEEAEPDGLGEGGERGGVVAPGERGGYAEVGLGRERIVGVEGVV